MESPHGPAQDPSSGVETADCASLTLITGVGRAEVTRDQVEAYCARREHDQNLARYFMAQRDT